MERHGQRLTCMHCAARARRYARRARHNPPAPAPLHQRPLAGAHHAARQAGQVGKHGSRNGQPLRAQQARQAWQARTKGRRVHQLLWGRRRSSSGRLLLLLAGRALPGCGANGGAEAGGCGVRRGLVRALAAACREASTPRMRKPSSRACASQHSHPVLIGIEVGVAGATPAAPGGHARRGRTLQERGRVRQGVGGQQISCSVGRQAGFAGQAPIPPKDRSPRSRPRPAHLRGHERRERLARLLLHALIVAALAARV